MPVGKAEGADGLTTEAASPRREWHKRLSALFDEVQMPIARLALCFVVITNRDISCMLAGTRKVREVERNVQAVGPGPLPDRLLERHNEIAAVAPFGALEGLFGVLSGPKA